ncbi:cbb3-type cytochrome oxidase assembly protein CcoS [Roseiconus nitratireducens]|uniref:Cbb3-type cytochrome oxidase assembly protein CcoS n=1 Tax=Roseiconus nitratireducens TaxID=2605748 RepID=A0A5M6DIX1_9BACT|nr:cbb3-type cytochrome oxidase assembly protein CcoS [Roseiconus nitratireducens]KAA5545205.1 cbb3-type cytochrome oxidase assembly protein CcoS [Roseiconus nitratireducens]
MNVLYIALPIAIAMGATALFACIRCIRSGQFDDLETPAVRMLLDDEDSVRRD